jgi:DNA-binding transcriptional regulator YdaS (Cro superfamily)
MEIEMTGIQRAIGIAGGANQLAEKLGVSHQAVYVWLRKGWVPAQRALEIEKLFDIPRVELFKPALAALFASN